MFVIFSHTFPIMFVTEGGYEQIPKIWHARWAVQHIEEGDMSLAHNAQISTVEIGSIENETCNSSLMAARFLNLVASCEGNKLSFDAAQQRVLGMMKAVYGPFHLHRLWYLVCYGTLFSACSSG